MSDQRISKRVYIVRENGHPRHDMMFFDISHAYKYIEKLKRIHEASYKIQLFERTEVEKELFV